jgi:hypothetical protein
LNQRCSCHGCHWQSAFLHTNTSNDQNRFLPNTRPNPRTAIFSESLMSSTNSMIECVPPFAALWSNSAYLSNRFNTASLFHVVPLRLEEQTGHLHRTPGVGEGKIADFRWNEDWEKACEMAVWNARVELG